MSKTCQSYAITPITPKLFWHALYILVNKPHVVNKRLWGYKLLKRHNCKAVNTKSESLALSIKLKDPERIDDFLNNVISCMEIDLVQTGNSDAESEIIIEELLPKNYNEKHAFQVILLQKKECSATFFDVTPAEHSQNLCPNFAYKFYLKDHTIELEADTEKSSQAYQWLLKNVLPQLNKWNQESIGNTYKPVNKSLALVSHDEYYMKYNHLKEKYGKELVKIWPESTDPSKFVYEDIAIASYLILVWGGHQDDNNTSQFVDMGCGNGLLVYILTMEGYKGYGVDVRKRKIWDMYPKNIKLLERTITPSNIHTFDDTNWVIGNHSDELTPWIPVIAARSSYKCKFFLLPCCAYNFDGTKYQRRNASLSQYTDYLDYIKELSENCGFKVCTDRLKIPSTKRICLVGEKRIHKENEYDKYCESIDMLIKSSIGTSFGNTDETNATNFKAREATEKVRNCTQVDRKVVESIISCVANYILEGCKCKQDLQWSAGKTVQISEIVTLIPPDTLKILKSECGGLQTLLKNSHNIFKVQSGKIQLRYPKTVEEMNRNPVNNKRCKSGVKLKVKDCWFYRNHPQGCPLKDAECSFLH